MATAFSNSNVGVKITNHGKVNCLLFADDIVGFADSQEDLAKLMQISKAFYDKWELTLNCKPTKSEILVKQNKPLDKKLFEQFCIEQGYYKYLGIPIGSLCIDTKRYFKQIK